MIHLTLTGVCAGQPLCGCNRDKEPAGTRYFHAVYAPIEKLRSEICVGCLKVWDETTEEMENEKE